MKDTSFLDEIFKAPLYKPWSVGSWACLKLRYDLYDFKCSHNGEDPEYILVTMPLFSVMFSLNIRSLQGSGCHEFNFQGVPVRVFISPSYEYFLCAKSRKFKNKGEGNEREKE